MIRIACCTLIVVLSSLMAAKAQHKQEDYVITCKGDTIKCMFRGKFWGRIKYRSDKQDRYMKIDTALIREYHKKKYDETYRALRLPNTQRLTFVKLIESGKINLYELLIQGSKSSTRYWYASKDDKPLYEINDTKLFHSRKMFQQNLSALLEDNEAASKEFKQQLNFNFKTIKSLIHFYNTTESPKS